MSFNTDLYEKALCERHKDLRSRCSPVGRARGEVLTPVRCDFIPSVCLH